MDRTEFSQARKIMNRTQRQMATLLGTSIKAIHSYEQGWRSIPVHVERQIYFLLSRMRDQKGGKSCWVAKRCPPERKIRCPAWEFRSGNLCWFINGTICEGVAQSTWKEKMKICRSCEVFAPLLLQPGNSPSAEQGHG
ncbi:MAG: transcriptional regulator [Thermoplasmata archaeon]|nr:MAG: transcriptional regulator [Thermoplasmata archaeon]